MVQTLQLPYAGGSLYTYTPKERDMVEWIIVINSDCLGKTKKLFGVQSRKSNMIKHESPL